MKRLAAVTAVLVLVSATPAAAQEHQVTRRTFTFIHNDLAIKVAADAPGVLRLARGGVGQIEVAARAPRGIAGFGLEAGGNHRLTLTSLGADAVDYLVLVPADVRVRVDLPDRPVDEHFGSLDHGATYRWNGVPAEPEPPAAHGATVLEPGMFLAYAGSTPATVSIPDARAVRTLTVRWEAGQFRIAGTRPLDVAIRGRGTLELRPPGARPADVVLVVPASVSAFELRVGAAQALVLGKDRVAALCTPLLDQRLDGGRRWFTFTPENGQLNCRTRPQPPAQRVGA